MILPFALALTCIASPAPQEDKAPETRPAPRLALRISPLVDLWFEVRARAESGKGTGSDDPLAASVDAMSALGRGLGSALAFGLVEGALEHFEDPADLLAFCGELPERTTVPGRGGPREVELRRLSTEVAHALNEAWPHWRADAWRARGERLAAKGRELNALLESEAGRAARAHLADAFAFSFERAPTVPVYLTLEAGWPGAVTHYRHEAPGGICFVALRERSDGMLLELALHEAIHAFDALSDGPNLLEDMRQALKDAGVSERAPAFRNWVHTLFFVHAGDTVRSFLDAKHEDYGVTEAYYPRMGAIAEVQLGLWTDLRNGAIDRGELIEAVVEAATAD